MIRINRRLPSLFAFGFLVLPLLPRPQEYNWAKIDEEAFEKNQPTEKIMDVIGIKAGMYVGEVGAGGGRVAVKVARRVGDAGRVFANDISESALAYMRERCVREKIQNMEVIQGTLTDPRFPPGKLDAVYLTFTYRHLGRPVDIFRNIAPALKPGGVLAVIESKSYNRESAKNEIIKNAGLAGYTLAKLETFLPEDDIYIFKVKNKNISPFPPPEGIHEAAKKGDIPALKTILDRNPEQINAPGEYGRSPLEEALWAKQGEAARFLVEAGADVNWKDAEGISPLAIACVGGDLTTAALLIDHKALIDGADSILGYTPLHVAALGGHAAVVRLLVDKGARLDPRSTNGRTPLAMAVENGKRECVEALLGRGAAAETLDDMGCTPLHRAVLAADQEIVKLLLAKKVDARVRNVYGNTPLDIAVRQGLTEIADLLSPTGKAPAAKFPSLAGPYLDQTPPGLSPRMFAPGIVSTEKDELNSVFTPDGKEFYFTIRGGSGQWTIMMMKLENGFWSSPRPASFSGRWSDVDLFITADGRRLYFCSNRPLEGQSGPPKDFDIWIAERAAEGWAEPTNLGAPVNSSTDEFYPSLTKDGTIYFQSRRPGGPGLPDIWRARPVEGRFVQAECLPPPVNSTGFEGDTLISPDESYLIVSTSRDEKTSPADLFLSLKGPNGTWTPLVKLGSGVCSPKSGENCQMLSPDGRFLFFTRGGDIYWVDAAVIKSY